MPAQRLTFCASLEAIVVPLYRRYWYRPPGTTATSEVVSVVLGGRFAFSPSPLA